MSDGVESILARRRAEKTYQQTMFDTSPIPRVSKTGPLQDSGSMLWFLFGLFLPPLGFLTWVFNRRESPVSCHRILKGMLAGIIVLGLGLVGYFGLRSMYLTEMAEYIMGSNGQLSEMPVLEGGSADEGTLSLDIEGYEVRMV